MGNRNGMMITQTEKDDAIEWLANRKQKIKSSSQMFDWENHLDEDSTLQATFEFVMEVAIKTNYLSRTLQWLLSQSSQKPTRRW
jgi:hypothetical protein